MKHSLELVVRDTLEWLPLIVNSGIIKLEINSSFALSCLIWKGSTCETWGSDLAEVCAIKRFNRCEPILNQWSCCGPEDCEHAFSGVNLL
jgi:hypothetical protein